MAENLGAADVLGEQQAIAALTEKPQSPTCFGAVDRLIDESIDRSQRILERRQ
jgi:3-carboxy-cis,cis-muconate cycloisomerase